MKFVLSLISVIGIAQATWMSGALQTNERFTYGKFKTYMKVPNEKGIVASFYTFWDGPGFYPNGWNEIDMNVVPSESNPLSMNAIYGNGHSKKEDQSYAQSQAIGDSWHTYEMEWTPESIAFSLDGVQIRRLNSADDEAVNFMHKAQTLRMNFWTPNFHDWGDQFNAEDLPCYLLVDYVEVYRYNQQTKGFDFEWRDDFNEFNQTRWHKNSGTFEGNSSIFSPSNVYTNEGNLVIKMEPSTVQHTEEQHHDQYYQNYHAGFHSHLPQKEVIHHEDYGSLIRDAIPDIDLPMEVKYSSATLGHLEPRQDLVDAQKSKYAAMRHQQPEHHTQPESHNLKAKIVPAHATRSHYQATAHQFDLNKPQLSLAQMKPQQQQKQQSQHQKPIGDYSQVQQKSQQQIHGGKKQTSQQQSQSQKQQGPQDKSQGGKQQLHPTPLPPHQETQQKQQEISMLEVMDETPYESEERRSHDTDLHYWETIHEPNLYDRLREHQLQKEDYHEQYHYHHKDYSQWEGIVHELPSHDMHIERDFQEPAVHKFEMHLPEFHGIRTAETELNLHPQVRYQVPAVQEEAQVIHQTFVVHQDVQVPSDYETLHQIDHKFDAQQPEHVIHRDFEHPDAQAYHEEEQTYQHMATMEQPQYYEQRPSQLIQDSDFPQSGHNIQAMVHRDVTIIPLDILSDQGQDRLAGPISADLVHSQMPQQHTTEQIQYEVDQEGHVHLAEHQELQEEGANAYNNFLQ